MSLLLYRGSVPSVVRTIGLYCLLAGVALVGRYPLGADYLPKVGPAALRFRAGLEPESLMTKPPPLEGSKISTGPAQTLVEKAPDTTVNSLGPVIVPPVQASTNTASGVPTIADADRANPATAVVPGPVTAEVDDPLLSNQVASPARGADVFTPQMMLQYFQRQPEGPRNQESGFVVPVAFSPPAPAPKASSKATYLVH